ncbi:MAG TPA: prenyltransferase/squalene oxidase repeat-containing protein [Candidatus Paceibacterota bacterium]|nr:prenyltransferase/squalene oxidase repeat-containing protein [Candidatus Paceibacterota bacterium]
MKKNILHIVLFCSVFGLLGFNFTNAEVEENNIPEPLVCVEPQVLNDTGDACIDKVLENEPIVCTLPQIINEAGDECVDPEPEVIVCTEPKVLVDGACVDPVNIHLQVISGTDSLYDNDISVIPCDSEGNGVMKSTPYCALVQSEVPSEWSQLWINSIGGISNDFNQNLYWMWLANLNIDNTSPTSPYNLSAKQYELIQNDNILFYYNTNPLYISVDNLTPSVGSDVTISVKEFGLDSSWNPVWLPSISKVVIGSNILDTDENGEYKIKILNTDSFTVQGQKDNFISSPLLTINPIVASEEENNEEENNTGSGGGGGSSVSTKEFSIEKALSFLISKQKSDGSLGDPLYTDWAAISAKAGENSNLQSSIKNYLKSNLFNSSVATDNERHAMALMSLNINPYTGTSVNYIKKITDSFDGTQIGESSLWNDDIFGLIVLQNAGYDDNDEIIFKTISFILNKQSDNGSWGSVDMTGAGIMALREFDDVEGVDEAISKAEDYLINTQNEDGGFDNPFSTSWALQALSIDNKYDNEVKDALEYLGELQEEDGGTKGSEDNNRVWATSYSIPAVLGLSWNDILEDFEKMEEENNSSGNIIKSSEEENIEPITVIPEIKNEDLIKPSEQLSIAPIVPQKILNTSNKVKGTAKNEVSIEIPPEENIGANVLAGSAYPLEENNNASFFEILSNILNKIKHPFVWLWIHLGF